MESLFDMTDAGCMWTTRKGQRVETRLHLDLLAYLKVVNIGAPEDEPWVHYCYVENDSYEHVILKLEIGSKCCVDMEESFEKTFRPVDNYCMESCWPVSAESRWTNGTDLLIRLLMGSLEPARPIPRSLSDSQVTWGIRDGMQAQLVRMIAADHNNWHASNKLRLLRCCQALAPGDSAKTKHAFFSMA